MAQFLSDDWFTAVDAAVAEAGDLNVPDVLADLIINISVTGDNEVDMCMNAGQFQRGHIDDAPTTLILPDDLARRLFVENDQAAGMQGFMSGQIRVEGDMSKLMAMQTAAPSSEQIALQKKILEFTD